MAYEIELSADAQSHLKSLEARDRAIILDTIQQQLTDQPEVPTRWRKQHNQLYIAGEEFEL